MNNEMTLRFNFRVQHFIKLGNKENDNTTQAQKNITRERVKTSRPGQLAGGDSLMPLNRSANPDQKANMSVISNSGYCEHALQ